MLAIRTVKRLTLMALSEQLISGSDLLRDVNSLGKQPVKVL
jgi:hypothetical protein